MTASAELTQDARRVASFPDDVTRRSVRRFAEAIRPRVLADTGGDGKLSGMRDGETIRIDEVVTGPRRDVVGAVTPGPPGMRRAVRWLDAGTRPHIGSRHPGTPPRSTIEDPVTRVTPVVLAEIDSEFRLVIR